MKKLYERLSLRVVCLPMNDIVTKSGQVESTNIVEKICVDIWYEN